MEIVRLWLVSPFSLWPIDFVGVAQHILKCIRNREAIDPKMELLMSFLKKTPSPREQAAIGSHELEVRAGNYETLITAQPKFKCKEEILNENPKFKTDWDAIKSNFNVDEYRDSKGNYSPPHGSGAKLSFPWLGIFLAEDKKPIRVRL